MSPFFFLSRTYQTKQMTSPPMPSFLASVGLTILAWLSIACGLILDTVVRGRREVKRLAYLAHAAPADAAQV